MAWFRRVSKRPAEVAALRLEIDTLRLAMIRHEEHVRSVAAAMSAPTERTELLERVDAIDQALADQSGSNVAGRLDAVVEQIGALDSRITSVSKELANQLSELGNDIESLQNRPAGEPVDEEVLDELRDTQERLANEQARYQIAFRADLARLAEQLRRPAR